MDSIDPYGYPNVAILCDIMRYQGAAQLLSSEIAAKIIKNISVALHQSSVKGVCEHSLV